MRTARAFAAAVLLTAGSLASAKTPVHFVGPAAVSCLGAAWIPLIERHRVDLDLHGHDHSQSLLTAAEGKAVSAAPARAGKALGPVSMVSVAGSSMHGRNARADTQPDRRDGTNRLVDVADLPATRRCAEGRNADGFPCTARPR